MRLGDILRGCEAGQMQSVGLMQVIPLLGASDERFGNPSSLQVRTSHYGVLEFDNPHEEISIVPRDAGYITKRGSQDHGMPETAIIYANRRLTYDRAACIEQTQGGYIQNDAMLIILPFPIREAMFANRARKGYDKVWQYIDSFNKAMDCERGGGHINVFLREYEKQLSRFVAEFEPVPGQIGAIVLVAGRIVGIERVPSEAYWLDIWETMIRECYGSLGLYFEKRYPELPPTRRALRASRSIEDLAVALDEAQEDEMVSVTEITQSLFDEEFTATFNSDGQFDVGDLESPQYVGQIVREGARILYASLTATKDRVMSDPIMTRQFKI